MSNARRVRMGRVVTAPAGMVRAGIRGTREILGVMIVRVAATTGGIQPRDNKLASFVFCVNILGRENAKGCVWRIKRRF